jgi:hypothetical protein
MHKGVAISISIALILIVGSYILRAGATKKSKGIFLTHSPTGINDLEEASTSDFISSDDSVNKTDNLGKQLITDLVTLNSSGQATYANISSLSDQYVNNISNLVKADTKTTKDLTIVGNSQQEVSTYSDSLSNILNKYQTDMKKVTPQTNTVDETFYSAVKSMGDVYKNTAQSLENMSVPSAMATLHLKLINLYLADTSAVAAIAETETDPAKAFSGLVNIQNNLDAETTVVADLNAQILKYAK